MMPARTHWLIAGLLSLAGHALVFAGGSQRYDLAEERAAGVPAAVWGVTAQSVMIELDPATPLKGIIKPVEPAKLKPLEQSVVDTVVPPADQVVTALAEEAIVAEPALIKAKEPPVETRLSRHKKNEKVVNTVKLRPDQAVTALAEEATVAEPELIEAKEPPVETKVSRLKKHKKKQGKKKPKKKQRAARASGGPVGRAAGSRGSARTASGRAAYNSYAGRVIAHLRRYKRYPAGAGRNRVRGTVRLIFVVGRSGSLRSARLTGRSGYVILDQEALSMVRRASPFPPFPSTLKRNAMTFTVPIRFKRQ